MAVELTSLGRSCYRSAVLSGARQPSPPNAGRPRAALSGLLGLLTVVLASCGGSSSETPPPLEPLPANVHYDRAATTLPGEIGTPTRPAAPQPSAKPEPTPFHPTRGQQ